MVSMPSMPPAYESSSRCESSSKVVFRWAPGVCGRRVREPRQLRRRDVGRVEDQHVDLPRPERACQIALDCAEEESRCSVGLGFVNGLGGRSLRGGACEAVDVRANRQDIAGAKDG